MIAMDQGAVLFDGVAISGTEAQVRAGGQRWVSGPMRVGGGGGGLGRRRRRMRLGCAQNGGVVSMGYGEVTFKGGTITNTKAAVRIGLDARSHTGTGCRMLRGLCPRGVPRALHADAGLDGPFERCGGCCGSHAAFGYGFGLWAARRLSVHTLRHRMVWCSVADGTLHGASWCVPAWVRKQ